MKFIKKYVLMILSTLLVFVLLYSGFATTLESTKENQKKGLEKALYRATMECYALEGNYPESLSYLLSQYQVLYNEDDFDIDYQVIASNIIPTITVIEK